MAEAVASAVTHEILRDRFARRKKSRGRCDKASNSNCLLEVYGNNLREEPGILHLVVAKVLVIKAIEPLAEVLTGGRVGGAGGFLRGL